MSISGIRAFGPTTTPIDDQHNIKFEKPLTLIVGSNAAGKTVSNV